MSILKSGGSPPFSPLPWSRDRWRVVVGRGGCWQVLAGHFGGGGAALVAILLAFPPHREIKFFASFSLVTWHIAYILVVIFSSWQSPSFWCKCNHQVMATFSCVALKAASAAQLYLTNGIVQEPDKSLVTITSLSQWLRSLGLWELTSGRNQNYTNQGLTYSLFWYALGGLTRLPKL